MSQKPHRVVIVGGGFGGLNAAWSFLSYDRGARLITGPLHREPDQARAERKAAAHRALSGQA